MLTAQEKLKESIMAPALHTQENTSLRDKVSALTSEVMDEKTATKAGMLLPLMLNEIAPVRTELFKQISQAWYGIYLYSMILDGRMDKKRSLTAEESLASSWILLDGMNKLLALVPVQSSRESIVKLINETIEGQFQDFSLGKNLGANVELKEKSSFNKNRYLIALSLVFETLSETKVDVVAFTRNVIIAIQYLDDITDYLEDYKEGNLSVLLQHAFGSNLIDNTLNDDEVFSRILASESLTNILEKTRDSIDTAFMSINSNGENFKYYCSHLSRMRSDVEELLIFLASNKDKLEEKGFVLGIKRRLAKIAFSS